MKLSAAHSTISPSSIAAVLDQRYEIAPVAKCRAKARTLAIETSAISCLVIGNPSTPLRLR
jgi:hypothetical protein